MKITRAEYRKKKKRAKRKDTIELAAKLITIVSTIYNLIHSLLND